MWDETVSPMLDALPLGVLVVDRDGRLADGNQAGLRLLGLDRAAVGRPGFPEYVGSDVLRAALNSPGPGAVRLSFSEGDRTLLTEVRPHGRNGTAGKLLLVEDVTERAGLANLRKNLVFDLLHKLRTPLTTVRSILSMAASGRLDSAKVDQRELLGMGLAETERLAGLFGRLRLLYLVETGEIAGELMVESIAVREAVEAAIDAARPAFDSRAHLLNVEVPEEPLRVAADREFLTRALAMVLDNAFHYTPAGGRVLVAAARAGDQVEIRIEDDGVGIAPDDLPHVFERFRRGRSGGVRSAEGEGLGLYLARAILHAQNGSILLDGKAGAGTTVEILLPAAEEDR